MGYILEKGDGQFMIKEKKDFFSAKMMMFLIGISSSIIIRIGILSYG